MAQTPKNILLRLGYNLASAGTDKTTLTTIRRWFLNAGYGKTKIDKWMSLYFTEGILYDTGETNDTGDHLIKCEWWLPCKAVQA